MKVITFLVLAVAASGIPGKTLAQGLPSTKIVTIDVAQTIAQEAMAVCRANGFKVTVLIVDAGNMQKALLRDDGASMGTIEVARMKANTVMAFGRPSGPPTNLPPGVPAPPPLLPGTVNAMGGLPIKVGEQVIGAVAVSGAPGGDKDAACATAGLAKVADKLK